MIKTGDLVKCVDSFYSGNYLIVGKVYLIESADSLNKTVRLKGMEHSSWTCSRFEVIEATETATLLFKRE